MPYSEAACDSPKEAQDMIAHARLTKEAPILMASDAMPGMPFTQGNNFPVSINCESLSEIERLFTALGEGGKIVVALQDMFWGAYGSIRQQLDV